MIVGASFRVVVLTQRGPGFMQHVVYAVYAADTTQAHPVSSKLR